MKRVIETFYSFAEGLLVVLGWLSILNGTISGLVFAGSWIYFGPFTFTPHFYLIGVSGVIMIITGIGALISSDFFSESKRKLKQEK